MSRSYRALGDIGTCRFVTQSASYDDAITESNSGDQPIGVSGKDTRTPPYSGLDDGLHAVSGEAALVYTAGDEALLDLGGTVTAGDYVKPDNSGKGVTASTDKDKVCVKALESGVDGERIRVIVLPPMQLSV
jgi:hypothetical protein